MHQRIILCPQGPFVVGVDRRMKRARQELAPPEIFIRAWELPVEVEEATVGDVLRQIRRLPPDRLRLLKQLATVSIARSWRSWTPPFLGTTGSSTR